MTAKIIEIGIGYVNGVKGMWDGGIFYEEEYCEGCGQYWYGCHWHSSILFPDKDTETKSLFFHGAF